MFKIKHNLGTSHYRVRRNNTIAAVDILLMCIYRIFMELHYAYASYPHFKYLGLNLDFTVYKYVISWCVFLLFVVGMLKISNHLMRICYEVLFVFSGIPAISLYALRNITDKFFVFVVLYWGMMCFSFHFFAKLCFKRKNINQKRSMVLDSVDKTSFLSTSLLIAIIGCSLFLYFRLGSRSSVSLMQSYDARSAFHDAATGLDVYLINWCGIVLIPWCYILAFRQKKWPICISCGLCVGLIFLCNGQKVWVFFLLIITFLLIIYKGEDLQKLIRWLLVGSIIIFIFSMAVSATRIGVSIVSIVERTYLVLGEVGYYYIDFLENNDFLCLSESIFSSFVESPYPKNLSAIVADHYMTAAYYRNATTGLLGDAYANFGVWGLFLYPFVTAGIMKILLDELRCYPKDIVFCIIFIMSYQLMNMPLFTFVISGGYLIMLLLVRAYSSINRTILFKI